MTTKNIRIWDGPRVICQLTVHLDGYSISGAVGGASNSTTPDLEIDPFAGDLVEHGVTRPPVTWRDLRDPVDEQQFGSRAALLMLSEVLQGSAEIAKENCESRGHIERDRCSCGTFTVGEFLDMINTAAADIGLDLRIKKAPES